MMDLVTTPGLVKDGRDGGVVYFDIFCQKCDELHCRKLYYGSPAKSMRIWTESKYEKGE